MNTMIRVVFLFTVLVSFTACLEKRMPVSQDDATSKKELGYIAISDSVNARPILDPSYDEIIEFMVAHKMDVNTHFIIERVQLSEDLTKMLIPTVGVDDFSESTKRKFILDENLSHSSGVFVIDVETDEVFEFQEGKVNI